ncbi:hypothetical protein TNCV_1297951 [Trichonephila clavipes]|nr:hypothetical protein TNCV_1297951 [Trichonephila clavipes]
MSPFINKKLVVSLLRQVAAVLRIESGATYYCNSPETLAMSKKACRNDSSTGGTLSVSMTEDEIEDIICVDSD